MKTLSLLLFVHVVTAAKHSLNMSLITTSGLKDFPEFIVTVEIDGVQSGYFDNTMEKATLRDDLAKKFIEVFPSDLQLFTRECHDMQFIHDKKLSEIKQQFGQSEGVHILQRSGGCVWDDEDGGHVSFQQYGYDGTYLASLDMQTMTLKASSYELLTLKRKWDSDKSEINHNKYFYHDKCPGWIKKYVRILGSLLDRTVLPSVSLLQKSPSSPVSCHASGFFPDRAVMFWRKEGEELFEDVEHGEILPNHDGTFQMSVDLLKAPPEDWGRYECVFRLSGLKEDIITKLERVKIKSNRGSGFPTDPVPGVVVVVLLLPVCITGLYIWRKKNKGHQLANNESEESEEEEVQLQK